MSKVCPTCNTNFPDSTAFCPADGSTLRAAELDGSLIGTVVADRYLVTELLGEGGMGKVYRARHVRLPREAAIKILHRHMVRDVDAIARFNREASSASRIEHERVARVFDFGETHEGLVYLAMEFIPGRTLKQVIAADGPMPSERAATIVQQIADGLDAAHALNIVHRDLKPDNILVGVDAKGRDQCKVVDFGIAKAVGADDAEHALTRTGFIVGTPEYMSPEQLLGQELDQRSDVYSLALVAYQCLTGETPFDTKTPDRGMMARLTGAPRPLTDSAPKRRWSPNVQRVLSQGLEREREKRFTSAGVFAKALASALAPEPAIGATAEPARASSGHAAMSETTESSVSAPQVAAAVARPRTPAVPTPAKARAGTPAKSKARVSPAAAVPAAPPPQYAPPQYASPQYAPPQYASPQPYAAPPLAAPPRVRVARSYLPHIPVTRWLTTLVVVWFLYLLVTTGSPTRAVRRALYLARQAPTSVMRMLGQGRASSSSPAPTAADPATVPDEAETPLPSLAPVAAPSITPGGSRPGTASTPTSPPPPPTSEAPPQS